MTKPRGMVEVLDETEGPVGWTFTVQVLDDDGRLRRHRVALSFADYNLWSSAGQDRPASVVAAVVRFLLARVAAAELRPAFDAAMSRRLYKEADREIPGLI